MSGGELAPVIIKRKKVVGGDGHHGGAWKVAYADFVTAMMAFFMLMWLLNATTEKQRKGIADYFSPTIPMSRISGGGDGAFGGDSVFTEETLPQNGTGASAKAPTDRRQAAGQFGVLPSDEAEGKQDAEAEALKEVEDLLMGRGGEMMLTENELKHVVTRLTDEGLVIEVFDLPGDPLFVEGTGEPTKLMQEMAIIFTRVLNLAANDIAVNAYLRTRPIVVADNPIWLRSSDRARALRELLEGAGVESARFERVTGFGDRKPKTDNPLELRNNRVEIILLRTQ